MTARPAAPSAHASPTPRPAGRPSAASGSPRLVAEPVLLGRQGLFAPDGARFGSELLFRSARPRATTPDRWRPAEQDEATRHVLEAALRCGLPRLGGSRPLFVNATRSLLLGRLTGPLPRQIGIEVVETLTVDQALLAGVERLRERGHLVAVDDFTATPDQMRLLPHADLVKIDLRDLVRHGTGLLHIARTHGARTVVERVETARQLERCTELGFDLVQGNVLEPALVLEVCAGSAQPWDAVATVSTARSTAKTGSRPAPLTSVSA